MEDLQNNFTEVKNDYPANMTEAYNLLIKYKTSYKPPTILVDDSEEVLFTNILGSEGKSNSYKNG